MTSEDDLAWSLGIAEEDILIDFGVTSDELLVFLAGRVGGVSLLQRCGMDIIWGFGGRFVGVAGLGGAFVGVGLVAEGGQPFAELSCEGLEGRKLDGKRRSLSVASLKKAGRGWFNPRRNGRDSGIAGEQ